MTRSLGIRMHLWFSDAVKCGDVVAALNNAAKGGDLRPVIWFRPYPVAGGWHIAKYSRSDKPEDYPDLFLGFV